VEFPLSKTRRVGVVNPSILLVKCVGCQSLVNTEAAPLDD
jgi:hypothetical protein